MHLRPGQTVGNYEVVREIARGGQGVVCEARDTVRGGHVALKLLLDTDPDALARFQREARTLQRLDHPHLIRVLDVGELPGGLPYMAMELVRGQHLKEWVRREGLPPLKGVVDLLDRVAEALHYCHEQGLIHRDIKPENVLLEDGTGRVVIVDFGLVRRRKLELAWSTQDQASLTEDGSILGTPAYMAPEQVSPELGEVDRRADVYALGGLLFFLLTGQPPFVGAGSWGLLVSVLTTPARDPREVRPDLPDPLAAFCLA